MISYDINTQEENMLSNKAFITQSLALDLFFLRIFKEHSIFLVAAFTLKDKSLIHQGEEFKNSYTELLYCAIKLSQGVIDIDTLESSEIVTKYTYDAERATEFYTGIMINSEITRLEANLSSDIYQNFSPNLTQEVHYLNNRALALTNMIIQFKAKLKNDVSSCKTFTNTYPLLIDHILREAQFYFRLLNKLQRGIEIDVKKDIIDQEQFWNRIMSEHSFFIRGLLDPTEVELFDISNNFGKEFEALTIQSSELNKSQLDLSSITENTIKATTALRDFKIQGTEGILNCKIKSVILPLLADHVLREANHYLRLLKTFKKVA